MAATRWTHWTRWTLLTVLTASLVALTGALGSAKDDVQIKIQGHYFAEPATVQLIVAVEPSSENRTLVVEADGENMFVSTELQLAGDKEQRLHPIEFRNLTAGDYTLRAQVRSANAIRSQDTQEIVVAGGPQ